MSSVKKLAYKLIVLSLMVAGLVILPMAPAERKAKAFAACEACIDRYEMCEQDCVGQPASCEDACESTYNKCMRTCN